MYTRESSRQFLLATLCLFLISSSPGCGVVAPDEIEQTPVTVAWDLVVLGRIDACWVCQNGPPPHVSYTRVLAGRAPSGQGPEDIGIVEVPARLLPQGGVPIYRSLRDEICYLTLVVPPSDTHAAAYKVVDVVEATPENLAKFKSVGQQ